MSLSVTFYSSMDTITHFRIVVVVIWQKVGTAASNSKTACGPRCFPASNSRTRKMARPATDTSEEEGSPILLITAHHAKDLWQAEPTTNRYTWYDRLFAFPHPNPTKLPLLPLWLFECYQSNQRTASYFGVAWQRGLPLLTIIYSTHMSPPDSSGTPESANSNKESSAGGKDAVDTLGEALAGVNLAPQSAAKLGSSALAGSALAPPQEANDGWGNFAETSAHSTSVFPASAGMTASTSGGSTHASNESLQRFLSQDPSQTLGDEVFKLSHPDLPSLNYEETKTDTQSPFRYPSQSLGLAAPDTNRRRSESPSGTGTTASSRSASPYTNGSVGGGAGRTIQAYQPFETDAAHSYSMTSSHGSKSNLASLDQRSPYSTNPYAKSSPYDQGHPQQQVDQNQAKQQQVLYMAVPSPDGRGQVLQPVQMVQMPGKPFTYMIPPGVGGAAAPTMQQPGGYYPQGDGGQQPVMVLPQMQNGGAMAPTTGDFSPGSRNRNYAEPRRDGYQNRPAMGADAQFQNNAGFAPSPERPPLDSLLGQIRRLSRDQVGCRLVQQALDEEGPTAATLILNEGLPFWGEAMVDPFGNYLFQKILEKITPEERIMLVKSVSTRLVNASLNLHGTRSVQKVVELCARDEQNANKSEEEQPEESAATVLATALAPAAARLCIDSHGNHVIQRILLKLGPKHSAFVFDAVAASVGDVARHRHGCCVIQRCLDSPPNEARAHLVTRIVDKALELMQDAYGNYVVQYVLDVCSDEDVQAVCEAVVGKVNLLAIQKFSSNVMEKCLERCNDRVKEMYLAEISDTDRVRELMMDPFGNYVVQRALSVATHTQAIRLVESMRPHLMATETGNGQRNGGVRNTAGGRRIIAKICRRFPNFTLNPIGSEDEIYSQNKGNQRQHNYHPQNQQHHRPHHHGHQQQYHHHGHQQQPPMMHSYAAVGGPAVSHHHYAPDPRMAPAQMHQQPPPQQQQQQPFYGLGGNAGYYDHFSSAPGGYTGM